MNYNVFTAIKILGFRCRLKKFLKDFNAEHMPQDAFTIKFIAAELKEKLLGGKISKITQPEKDMLLLYTPLAARLNLKFVFPKNNAA